MSSRERLYTDVPSLQRAIDDAAARGMNFYAYRLPLPHDIDRLPAKTAALYKAVKFGCSTMLSTDMRTPGFVVSPFDKNSKWPTFVIPSEYTCFNPILPFNIDAKNDKKDFQPTKQEDYDKQINSLISHLNRRGGKVVLSRVICGQTHKSLAKMIVEMCLKYPNAFVFCYHTSFTDTWLGASPELLLQHRSGRIQTMSLAGTRPAGSIQEWDEKNLQEQRIVTQYICDIMRDCGMRPELTTRYTRRAGDVEHICNDITADLPADIDVEDLLDRLAPTPALCGYPKQSAMNMIRRIEHHDRSYYGGYVGISNGLSRHSLFVNLRSAKLRKNERGYQFMQFCGGGITAASEPVSEWNETEIKSRTLASIFKNNIG